MKKNLKEQITECWQNFYDWSRTEEGQEALLKHGCLVLSILSWLLITKWFLAIPMAVISFAAGFIYAGRFKLNRKVIAGMLIAGTLLVTILLWLICLSVYSSFLHIGD